MSDSPRAGASFEASGLTIHGVRGRAGPLRFEHRAGDLHVDVPAGEPAEITVDYGFQQREQPEGATPTGTFIWPQFCKNLFPCKSDPADGLRFRLAVENVPAGNKAIFPAEIAFDAPSYMIAWAIGDYTERKLGTTTAGTQVSVYYRPKEVADATKGTRHLVAAFDWYEKTYGPYRFGPRVASVSASWRTGAFGGMEHHPYWHVASTSMHDEETHAHEAAHGWFGDGVRLRCWEDLVLSEGTTSYVAARALEAVAGPAAAKAVWTSYRRRLDKVVKDDDRVAWPASCGKIDVRRFWNDVVYTKGAFFLRAVEEQVGPAAVDRSLARLYRERVGSVASVSDLLAAVRAETGFDATGLADAWLRRLGAPTPRGDGPVKKPQRP